MNISYIFGCMFVVSFFIAPSLLRDFLSNINFWNMWKLISRYYILIVVFMFFRVQRQNLPQEYWNWMEKKMRVWVKNENKNKVLQSQVSNTFSWDKVLAGIISHNFSKILVNYLKVDITKKMDQTSKNKCFDEFLLNFDR